MIRYEDNPNLKLKTVVTVRGDTEYRRNCKHIGGNYYVMDRDCFCIEGKWYRFDGGHIVQDHEKKIWIRKSEATSLARGVVGFEESGKPIFGYYTLNPYGNVKCRLSSVGIQNALNQEVLLRAGYIEDVGLGVWFNKRELGLSGVKRAKTIRNERSFTDRGYNIEDNPKDFKIKTQLYNDYDMPISKNARIYSKYLGDITFGAEIEIARGNLPEHIQNRYGIVVCRDGSIDGGPELVTIPISGAKGLQTLNDLAEELENRGDISLACAFHLHIGNVRTDKLFLAAFYSLCRRIQDELFTMFPYYKTDPKGIKRKNYNQKLDGLGIHPLLKTDKESYEAYVVDTHAKIFDFLSDGRMTLDQFNKKTREHPIPRKWERSSRYYWANLMNMFFTHRNTVEFRLHTPTTNSHKMVNWLFICNAIVKYADRYAMDIITSKKSISIKEVLAIYEVLSPKDEKARFLSEYIYEYFLERQERFQKDLDRGDKVSKWDIEEDKQYQFSYKNVKGLV
jgi:hypothetical protein